MITSLDRDVLDGCILTFNSYIKDESVNNPLI